MKWKVVMVGPSGAVLQSSAFRLLYQFPTREEAEAHADCFRSLMKVALCDERGNLTACGASFGAGTTDLTRVGSARINVVEKDPII